MPAEPVLVGVDVGTTFCKAAVVDLDGVEIAHGRVPTPWQATPTGAQAEPGSLLDAAVAAARAALTAADGRRAAPEGGRRADGGLRVLGVGVASMAETGVLLDRADEPVAPAIAWHDTRGAHEAAELAAELGDAFPARTGLRPSPVRTIAKFRWLRRHHAEAARGARWLSLAEWVVAGLGGQPGAELSLASRTGWLDLAARRWWDDALAWAGAPDGLLAEPAVAGTPMGTVRARLDEAAGAVLTVAGHDHPCAAVGAGATRTGDLLDSCGTAEALVRPLPALPADRIGATAVEASVGWHVVDGQHTLQGGFPAGAVLERVRRLLGAAGQDAAAALDAAALDAPSGAGGMRFDGVAAESLTLSGIGRRPTPGLVWRAALEAVAAHAATIQRRVEAVAGASGRVVLAGGWARNPAFRAVKAAAIGPCTVAPVGEAGARGAALLAGLAVGCFPAAETLPPPPQTSAVT